MQANICQVGHALPFSPVNLGETRAEVHYDAVQISIILIIDLQDFTRIERKRILADPIEVRIALCHPLLLFLVSTSIANFDVPFSSAINGQTWHSGLMLALQGAATTMLTVVFVHKGIVRRIHRMVTGPSTSLAIANALQACPATMTLSTYNSAITNYQQRFSPNELVAMSRSFCL